MRFVFLYMYRPLFFVRVGGRHEGVDVLEQMYFSRSGVDIRSHSGGSHAAAVTRGKSEGG